MKQVISIKFMPIAIGGYSGNETDKTDRPHRAPHPMHDGGL